MFALDFKTYELVKFNTKSQIKLKKCGKKNFRLWHISPILENGVILLGELNKVVPMSK